MNPEKIKFGKRLSKITAPTYTEIDAKAKAMVRKLTSKSFIT